ncbi:MAG: hypothetical protein OES14_00480 [Nitrosopumilus sp.]|nr:hypothetical protein [Nitrosopumilus sp.]MDH3824254.1 hypothetical protein [Nitrosopumilus sp.]
MYSKIITNALGNEDKFLKKIQAILKLAKHYNNLQKGIRTKTIYLNLKKQDSDLINFLDKVDNYDISLMKKLFRKETTEFLKKRDLKKHIDLDNKIGLEQIGFNTIFVEKSISAFWTTGRANFFIPTEKKLTNKITIEIRSIVPLDVTVGFEDTPIKTVKMSKLSTKQIEIIIQPTEITNDVSEIYIKTDRLWLPNVILDTDETVALGVGVKSINVSYF